MASHSESGLSLLSQAWELSASPDHGAASPFATLVDAVFQGREAGYKKAIIIQAAGKAANPQLDAQAMQKGDGNPGSWDAREFAKQSFVRWNLAANEPFSHSADPYVSNPYRIPRFDEGQRFQRRNKPDFDAALAVLQHLNATEDADVAFGNLVEILRGLRRWIADKDVAYPIPNRASLRDVTGALDRFLGERSGGSRLQAVVAAIIESLAAAGFTITDISSAHVNSSDVSGQRAGDVSFVADNRIFAVEVKDRPLTRDEFEASIAKSRVAATTDLLFVIRATKLLDAGLSSADLEGIIARQFSSGLNIYVEDFVEFSRVCLTLIGEQGRRTFLEAVGRSLSVQAADIAHKWAWADIVKAI